MLADLCLTSSHVPSQLSQDDPYINFSWVEAPLLFPVPLVGPWCTYVPHQDSGLYPLPTSCPICTCPPLGQHQMLCHPPSSAPGPLLNVPAYLETSLQTLPLCEVPARVWPLKVTSPEPPTCCCGICWVPKSHVCPRWCSA